jgi:hypothetical protein
MEEYRCTLKERLHSFAIGVGLAVVLLATGWCAVTFTWSESDNILCSAQSHTDRLMTERSALLVAADASMPHAR